MSCLQRVRTIQSKSGENASLNFVETALTVHEKILSHAGMREIVLRIDAMYNKQSPFAFMCNLDVLAHKSKSQEQSLWMLNSMDHMLLTEQCGPKDFSKQTLSPAKQKGYLDLMLLKKDLLSHLVSNVLPSMELSDFQRQSIAELKTHEMWRARTKSLAWTGTLPESGRLFVTLLQSMIYGNATDGNLKTRSGRRLMWGSFCSRTSLSMTPSRR